MGRCAPGAPVQVLAAALALVALAPGPAGGTGPALLVAMGDVAATTAVVWARLPAPGEVAVSLKPAAGEGGARGTLEITRRADFTGKLVLSGLTPATRYAWQARGGGETVTGEFVTAPAADARARVRFLWSGDLGGGGFCRPMDGGYRIFRTMALTRPDFFLFVGDTIYADIRCDRPGVVPGADFVATRLDQYRARHRYQREDPALQELLRATSVDAIWDDHEVRNDFSGPTEPLMPTGSPARRDSWSNASVYGTPQEGGTGFAVERDALLRQLRERGVKNLVFVVADVHHAEIIRHHPAPGWSFHEFVAGPLSARFGRPRPLDEGLNPRSLFARSGVNNFGEVTLEPTHLTVRLYDEEGAVLFTHTIKPDERLD